MVLVASIQKQKRKEKGNYSEERIIQRIIVPTMNHTIRRMDRKDPEFSTEKVSNPSI